MNLLKRLLTVVCTVMAVNIGFAQVENQTISGRNYEAAVVSASTMASFHGLPITNLYLYAYDSDASSWRVVPFQIDERSSNGNYFDNDDGLLDEYDEMVFLIKDMGDRVPDGFWIDNEDSRSRPRFEIEANDAFRGGQKAWVYLVNSTTINNFVFEDYLTYDEEADQVHSKFYQVGFDAARGLPNWYSVPEDAGGTNQDILDRMKIRIEVSTNIIGNVSITEDHFIKEEISPFPNSQVRFVRNMRTRLRVTVSIPPFPPYEVVNEDSIYIPIFCYPYYLNVASDELDLDLGSLPNGITATLKVIRNSQDFNSNAVGMYFYNVFNPDQLSPNLVDGAGDSTGIDRTLIAPGLNWNMLTGTPGTLLVLNFVPLLGDKQELYFWDRLLGGTMDHVNGNGDFTTYGDHGFLLTGNSITGTFRLLNFTYLLPPVEDIHFDRLAGVSSPAEIGEVFRDNLQNPVQLDVNEQMFDIFPPKSVQDLRVLSSTDSTLTVGWTSPGDDSSSGMAQTYDLRLSTTVPEAGNLESWFSSASRIENLSAPRPAGMEEMIELSGVHPDSVYYLAIKTTDEAGNQSDISNVVSEIVLSVELTSFQAEAFPGEVRISWQTYSEKENAGFEVQRSNEGLSFETIAFVPGSGQSNAINDYVFIDSDVITGKYYYRLKQVNADGSFEYLNVIGVYVKAPGEFTLYQNYPNPFNPTTAIEYQLTAREHVVLKIYNLKGQLMSTPIDEIKPPGRHKVQVDASDWPSGLYIARLSTDTGQFTRKMLLMR